MGLLELKLLLLIFIANGSPILARNLLSERYRWPLDFGQLFPDGQRILGKSKTFRGLLSAIVVTSAVAWLMGLPALSGAVIGLGAMLGDLISSFIKRRMKLAPSEMAIGLDQIPEALLPLLMAKTFFQISSLDILVLVTAFLVLGPIVSLILYKLKIRKQPY